jgi:Uma2 family endonuclease
MTVVTSLTTPLPVPDAGWTADDLDAFPDDGLRYELVDGVLLVSAAPSEEHQIAAGNLFIALTAAAPEELRVLTAPFDVRFGPRRQLQPDLVVLPKDRTVALRRPVLVVEVLSPSTRATDLTLKRHVFEQGGVASYWLVDPMTPSLTVLELRAGSYVEVAQVSGAEPYEAAAPFRVRVVPAELVR